MVNKNFFKYLLEHRNREHETLLSNFNFNFVYGNGTKNISKSKAYIYQEFEFYSNDVVDKSAYIEQILIDNLKTIPEIDNLNDTVLCLETNDYFYITYLSQVRSYTVAYTKKKFTFEQIELLLIETIGENIIQLIMIYYYATVLNITVLHVPQSTIDKLELDNFEISNSTIEPKIIYDQSLKLKENLKRNKNNFIYLLLIIGIISANEIYVKDKIVSFVKSKHSSLKMSQNSFITENNNIIKIVKEFEEKLKQSEIQQVDVGSIVDFKANYRNEIKKLF